MDINYILNGKRKKKKSNNMLSIFRPRPLQRNISMQQLNFLRKTKSNIRSRFTDHDGDGVISGLDCRPYNKKMHMAWSKGTKTNLPLFEGYFDENKKDAAYEKRRVKMDSNTFLKRQYEQSGAESEGMSQDEWEKDINRERVESLKKSILSDKDEVPTPVEEYNTYGERQDFQEGRHRGIAAKELGENIPVILARKKYAPWDREDENNYYTHKKTQWFHPKNNIDNRWEKEINDFENDDDEDDT